MSSGLSLGIVIYNDIRTRSDSDGDSIPDHIEDRASHPLFFKVSDEMLTYSTFDNDTSPTSRGHEVGHNLDISHAGLSSHLKIHSSLYDDVSTGIPILEFNVKYDSLIEFIDGNSNGYYDPATDTVIGKAIFTNLGRSSVGFGIDGQPAYYSGYSTVDGVVNVDFYTSREHVLLGRQVGLLAPNELKSFITFTDYVPLTGGTNLALNLSLSSNNDFIFSSSNLALKVATGSYEMEYEWLDWAILDGVNTTVNATVPSTPIPLNTGEIYINFGQFTNVSYDPKLSWQLPSSDSSFNFFDLPWPYIAMGSIAILMVVTTTRVVRKKPGRLTYQPIATSSNSKKTSKTEKRIPGTLRHRDR
ncbi:MAG: hypothetical protein ACW99E_23330 [Promethearchaeota archaeon]|jgi:hypothetical protein